MSTLSPVNQYSYVILAALIVLGLTALFWITGFSRRKGIALGVVTAAFVAAWMGFRPGSAGTDPAQAELVIRTTEQPVLIQFYSDYCAGCMATKPTLDALELEYRGQLTVVRLDIASATGQALSEQLGARLTPTYILFDAAGNELWRMMGGLDAAAIRAMLGRS